LKSTTKISAALILAVATTVATAQSTPTQQPSPEQMRQVMQATMQATMDAMLASVKPMVEATIEAQLAIAAKPETAERLASFKKNLYDALLRKGFTDQQALQIVIATSPPAAVPATK
jgi:transposase